MEESQLNGNLFNGILSDIRKEYSRACKTHPIWPDDIIHGVSIVCEESGEAIRAALNAEYHGTTLDHVDRELVQTATTAIRALIRLRRDASDYDI